MSCACGHARTWHYRGSCQSFNESDGSWIPCLCGGFTEPVEVERCPVCDHLRVLHEDGADAVCGECRDWGGPCEP